MNNTSLFENITRHINEMTIVVVLNVFQMVLFVLKRNEQNKKD